MRCLNRLGANVVIQPDANDGPWTGAARPEPWQPLAWMGSAYRAVSDLTVHFTYAVNPFMVGNLADTPFDGQSAILQRSLGGAGCAYVGNRSFESGQDISADRRYAGPKPQFLASAPWVVPDGSRAVLGRVGAALAAGTSSRRSCIGQARRPPRCSTATWTERCAPASGQQPRSAGRCERAAAPPHKREKPAEARL